MLPMSSSPFLNSNRQVGVKLRAGGSADSKRTRWRLEKENGSGCFAAGWSQTRPLEAEIEEREPWRVEESVSWRMPGRAGEAAAEAAWESVVKRERRSVVMTRAIQSGGKPHALQEPPSPS